MVLLPTLCPDCNGLTMKVVKYGLDDSYEARYTTCGYLSRLRQDCARTPDCEGWHRCQPAGNRLSRSPGYFSFWQTESARRLLSRSFQAHPAEQRYPQSCSLACWPRNSLTHAVFSANWLPFISWNGVS
jgi:hypothetical protein